jgi:hypothetical protein
LGRTLDELPPQTRRLLEMVHGWAGTECARLAVQRTELRFTRRQVRALTGWGDTQLKVHLARLAELEYLLVHRVKTGQGFEYELLYDGEGAAGARFLMGLAAADGQACGYDAPRSGVEEARSSPGRGVVAAPSAPGRPQKTAIIPAKTSDSGEDAGEPPKTPITRRNGADLSYHHPLAASA